MRRHFKAVTGIPLHGYILQRRLANARALLADTEIPIKAIAETLGYKDVYFFTRQFRQIVGVPPASFRRSRQ
jgi:AraC-like DNA-binding protein